MLAKKLWLELVKKHGQESFYFQITAEAIMGYEYKVFILMLVILLTVLFVSSKITSGTPSNIIVVPDNYSTVAAAIGNASNGDTILIRSGIYVESSLTINKTFSLIGENAQNTI
ncbi:MAG TPA: hypothetical protein VF350_02785, partial [Candidatus Bathyarchaeia archaeon]